MGAHTNLTSEVGGTHRRRSVWISKAHEGSKPPMGSSVKLRYVLFSELIVIIANDTHPSQFPDNLPEQFHIEVKQHLS